MDTNHLVQEYRLEGNEDINLSDFALFLMVMKNKEAHQSVLSIIMDDPELELKSISVEDVIMNDQGLRAIRLDATAVDSEDRKYATEMQNDTDHDDMRKRSRYYQSMVDQGQLKSGKETHYKDLPPSVVTFITQEDIFKKDLAKYTFYECCEEIEGLKLDDGTKKIFLNMSSKNGDPTLISLLQYMKNTQIDNPEILVHDQRIINLDNIVHKVKESREWEELNMSIYAKGIQRGHSEGRVEGRAEGRIEGHSEGLVEATITTCQKLNQSREATLNMIMKDYKLGKEEAESYMTRFWQTNEG